MGNGYRFGMQLPGGELFHLAGEFLEIDAPNRLAYTFRWDKPTPMTARGWRGWSLDAVGGATEVSLIQGEFATDARLALHGDGWRECIENLRALLGPAI